MDLRIQRDTEDKHIDLFGTNRSAPTISIDRPKTTSVPRTVPGPTMVRPANNQTIPHVGAQHAPQHAPQHASSSQPIHQPPPPVSTAAPPPSDGFDFRDFANQGRVRDSPSASDDDDDDDDDGEYDGGDVEYQRGDANEYPDSTISDYVERPSPGFESIEAERNALLFKIHRAIRGGMPVDKPDSGADIRDLRAIVGRIESEVALDRSIKFQRKMVCMLTSSIEWLNGRYEWSDLDGWSDSVATSISASEYDDIFEELHQKYRGSMQIMPELRLVFALAASAFWFNLSKSMSKQLANSLAGNASADAGQKGGFDLSSLLGSMMGGGQTGNKQTPQPNKQQPPPPSQQQQTQKGAAQQQQEPRGPTTVLRKPMKGPDMSAMFGGTAPSVFVPQELPKMTESRKRSRDDEMDMPDDKSDRLSDIVSSDDDGSSGPSDDSSSGGSLSGSSDEDDQSIKITTVPARGGRGGRGRGRGRGTGRGTATKNVLKL